VAAKKPPKASGGELTSVLAAINSQFGAGTISRYGDEEPQDIEVTPTGSIALNEALGRGGFPRGRIIELYGPESSGKTSVALHAAGIAQRAGGTVGFIDAEHALDPEWAVRLGVDMDDMLLSQPDTGEQALEVTDMLVRSGKLDMIIIDSVSALVPKAEIDGEMGDSHVGLQARLMSQALRKMAGSAHKAGTTVIFINQLREKVGVLFGSPETTSGGKALKFYASVRLDVRRIETLKDGTTAIGNRVRVKVVKNKVGRPFQVAEFDFLYSCGISRERELLDFGVDRKVLIKSGSWYAFEGQKIGNGKDDAARHLDAHPEIADEIERRIYAAGLTAAPAPKTPARKDGDLTDGSGPAEVGDDLLGMD
jgi:recombination protein RecA